MYNVIWIYLKYDRSKPKRERLDDPYPCTGRNAKQGLIWYVSRQLTAWIDVLDGASPVASTSKKADRTSPKAVPKKALAVNPAPGSPPKGPAAISKDETSKTAIPPKLRAVERVHGIIREIADRLHLSQVIENRCKLLFKTIQDGNHCPSRSHKVIGSACVYISCM